MPDLSIIIVSWNAWELLDQCLHSIYQQLRAVHFEILYVDNASEDNSVEQVQARYPFVKVFCNDQNLGFAKANNIALRAFSGRYALLLNNDTILLPGAIETLIAYMDENPQVGACGPLLVYADETPQVSYGYFPSLWTAAMASPLDRLFPPPLGNHRLGIVPRLDENPHSVDYIRGACLFVRREVVEQVGLMDERFFLYCEETDWCYRIRQKGWEIHYVPTSRIVHIGSQGLIRTPFRMHYELYHSLRKFVRKYHPGWYVTLLGLVLVTALTANSLAFFLLGLFRKDYTTSRAKAQDLALQASVVVKVWLNQTENEIIKPEGSGAKQDIIAGEN